MTTAVKKPVLADRLADYATNISYDKLPKEAVQEAKRRIIDSFGTALGAISCGSEPANIAIKVAQTASSEGGATVFTTKHKSTPDLAAFAIGTAIRYLDFNDTYLSKEPAHPSDNIAAILAVAEAEKKGGKDILTAIVLAYEIQCRLCDAASIRSRGWDHVTYGAFSAGLAAGKLYGLSRQQLVHVQGLAATPNITMRQTRVGELSHWKGCAFANASRNAVFAAILAKNGMTGPSEIFEGEMAFWKQVSGEFTLAPFGGEEGEKQYMINKTYVKHFPAEYHSQSAIEAALELREQIGAEGIDQKITSIRIESFDAAVEIIAGFEEHWHPKTRETADHSMPYCVSAALMDGDITLDTFTTERINDKQLIDLVQKVSVVRSAEMNAGYPEGIPNNLIITTTDGQEYRKQITYPLGHAGNPMNDDEINGKFRTLAKRLMSDAWIDKILAELQDFENCTDVTKVMGLFADALKEGRK